MQRGWSMKVTTIEELNKIKKRGFLNLYPQEKMRISIGTATCGKISGGDDVFNAARMYVENSGIKADVIETGCIGFCQEEPIVSVTKPNGVIIFYSRVIPEDIPSIISLSSEGKVFKEKLLGKITEEDFIIAGESRRTEENKFSQDEKEAPLLSQHPFYKKQIKIVLRNCGFINPDSIEEYIARGGYFTAMKVILEGWEPERVIQEIINSGLRGRGGGGFPTGKKWKSCREAKGYPKYVICNADEGDPGAYMDRSVLEGDPHSVIEGMIIGAFAIGANHGYIYVRHEYPLAVKRFANAVAQAREMGFLGKNIFGKNFDFDIKIAKGGGAFVCGESTALMASLEGNVGEPRAKFIHTVESGVWDKPSNLNNVETWANVPVIIDRGADWFKKIGTQGSTGTKVFSLVGKVKRTGLVEVPMGITLREMIFDIGGGSSTNKKFKAIQTGGPSGGAIPVLENGKSGNGSLIDLPVDFDRLTEVGSMMGSGGMIVMDEETCMVDVARYFTNFLVDESCGKCTTCREGLRHAAGKLKAICEGKGKKEHIEILKDLAEVIAEASLCALGGTAPNPLLSTLKYFPEEYDEHINEKVCRALVCKALITYSIDENKCTACRICEKECPSGAISGGKNVIHTIDPQKCIKCNVCFDVCKYGAVIVSSGKYSRRCEHTKTNLKPIKERVS